MDICDFSAVPGRGFRICDESDDAESAARGLCPLIATLRRIMEREARDAAAMTAKALPDGWRLPAPPVHVESQYRDL